MDILRALILGAVQGLTEFLPISSSAHLIIIPWLAGWDTFGLAFDVALHMGTLLAILIYFWRELLTMLRGILSGIPQLLQGQFPSDPMGRTGIFIGLATIPGALAGFLGEGPIDDYFHEEPISNGAIYVIAVMLIALGIALAIADRSNEDSVATGTLDAISLRQALLIGLAQTLALIPGTSRSGSTIAAGLFLGLNRSVAAQFSFLLGIPLIVGAGVKQGYDLWQTGIPAGETGVFIAGTLTAASVGYLTIAGLLRFLRSRSLDIFVGYRLLLGIFLIFLVALGLR